MLQNNDYNFCPALTNAQPVLGSPFVSAASMRSFKNIALGLIGAAAVASASDVHELKADTFPDFIKENPLVLAECTLLALPLDPPLILSSTH